MLKILTYLCVVYVSACTRISSVFFFCKDHTDIGTNPLFKCQFFKKCWTFRGILVISEHDLDPVTPLRHHHTTSTLCQLQHQPPPPLSPAHRLTHNNSPSPRDFFLCLPKPSETNVVPTLTSTNTHPYQIPWEVGLTCDKQDVNKLHTLS